MISPKIKFYVVKKARNSPLEVRLITSIAWAGERLIYYPGITMKEYQWDREQSLFRNIANKDILNQSLQRLKKQITDIHHSLSIRYGKVSPRHFKNELKKIRWSPAPTITDAFIKFMEVNESRWSKNTFLRCRSLYPKLARFTEYYASSPNLESVDKEFLVSFEKFLQREGLSDSSRYSYMNLIKWFLSWGYNRTLFRNDEFKKYNFTRSEKKPVDPLPVYLKRKELTRLFSSGPDSEKLQHCRDIYCLMAFTGCSLDELQNLKKGDVGEKYILFSGKKKRKVPLNNYTKIITDRYKSRYYSRGSFMPVYSKMSLNKYIRELCIFLKFDRELMTRRRGAIVESTLSKMITINSARWTFYANAADIKLSPEIVQSWSGIRSLKFYFLFQGEKDALEDRNVELINRNYENTF